MNSAGTFIIGHDHPALPGHFPGHPIVPGVVLLDRAVLCIAAALGTAPRLRGIAAAKFLAPVAPGEPVQVRYLRETETPDTLRVVLEVGTRVVASGTLLIAAGTA